MASWLIIADSEGDIMASWLIMAEAEGLAEELLLEEPPVFEVLEEVEEHAATPATSAIDARVKDAVRAILDINHSKR